MGDSHSDQSSEDWVATIEKEVKKLSVKGTYQKSMPGPSYVCSREPSDSNPGKAQEYDLYEPDKPTTPTKKVRIKLEDASPKQVVRPKSESRKDSKKPVMNRTKPYYSFTTVADAIQAFAVALSHDRGTLLGDVLHNFRPNPLELTANDVLRVRSKAAELQTDDIFEKVNLTLVQAVIPKAVVKKESE
ncbi:uncharacterized protein MYCFIDRAFT_84621 [Pseudocercospora fijiensis CIRAD86]|uniref:Uncharacterized protein n=1 Tax=Pseudocercospora fijiensis (strain CIRAD86) TaxID=383855 RepID=M3AIS1_PSEFD|nr:uncharacterized protein MYCFIDRAFT_84621 [Pseudocercospora fijiensis CIRAD86]EME77093.1 hypothetical protein MYCFIDRAFT_84621 [Pseudocercospora fijiensis CIRAD86]